MFVSVVLSADDDANIDGLVKTHRVLHKGDYLFKAGDRFKNIYAIRSGSFKSFIIDADGGERINGFYLLGELLGFAAIAEQNYHYSSIALETASVCEIPFDDLFELATNLPNLQRQILNLMSQRLAPNQPRLLSSSAEQRFATFLLTISSRMKRCGLSAKTFKLSMSRQDIANYLGLAAETVSRLFSRLQQDGIITIERHQLCLTNIEALTALGQLVEY